MTEQDYLHQQLHMLRETHDKAAKPIIDRLIYLKGIELGAIVVPIGVAQDLGLMPKTITDPAEIRRVFELDDAEYPPPESGFMKLEGL